MRRIARYSRALATVAVAATALSACGKDADPSKTAPPAAPAQAVATRGVFGGGSCDASARIAVADNAAFAVYFDRDGNELDSAAAEDLAGTSEKLMCPLSLAPEQGAQLDPGICTPLCSKVISRKTYCVPCS